MRRSIKPDEKVDIDEAADLHKKFIWSSEKLETLAEDDNLTLETGSIYLPAP